MKILPCLLAIGLCGCLIPIGGKTSSGHRHSDEALAFLDHPGTTRPNVLANLGSPLIESKETRTLVYVWHQQPRYLDISPHPDSAGEDAEERPRPMLVYGFPEEYALFVAFDEKGLVVAHEIRFVDDRPLEEECRRWNRERKQ